MRIILHIPPVPAKGVLKFFFVNSPHFYKQGNGDKCAFVVETARGLL
jgi:hypothetical protein